MLGVLFFEPDFKERVWGGQKLKTVFNKAIPYEHTGESWEVACHDNGNSVIRNGKLKGLTLKAAIEKEKEAIIGERELIGEKFPLLIKFIDAKAKLSVQVHPDDAYAYEHENGEFGKNEAWYILEAAEGAKLVAGLKEGITKEDFIKALEEERLEEVLNQVEVKAGDVLDIPAGFIHAIGDDIMLLEIQQNSDATYRVYDWERVGLDGEKRALHVSQSLDVSDFEGKYSTECVDGLTMTYDGYEHTIYITNRYFSLEKVVVTSSYAVLKKENNFDVFMCVEGEGSICVDGEALPIVKGDSFLVPSCVEDYTIQGNLKLIKTYVPTDINETYEILKEKGFSDMLIEKAVRLEK